MPLPFHEFLFPSPFPFLFPYSLCGFFLLLIAVVAPSFPAMIQTYLHPPSILPISIYSLPMPLLVPILPAPFRIPLSFVFSVLTIFGSLLSPSFEIRISTKYGSFSPIPWLPLFVLETKPFLLCNRFPYMD